MVLATALAIDHAPKAIAFAAPSVRVVDLVLPGFRAGLNTEAPGFPAQVASE
jgi:hypothetical protein